MNSRFNQLFSVAASMIVIICMYFIACTKQNTKEDNNVAKAPEVFFSKEDVSSIKTWIKGQSLVDGKLTMDNFPRLSFSPVVSSSDSALVAFYLNGIMYVTDDIINGKKADYEIIINMINDDQRLDQNGKTLLKSNIQLHKEVYTSLEVIEFYNSIIKKQVNLRGGCNCDAEWYAYNIEMNSCRYYGNQYGFCDRANIYLALWNNCKNKTPGCPGGFSYDGANCYSGVHFPSGYNGFVYGNGFYTQQNCNISTANDCCPPGFGYDGANCHYWGLYFPSNYEAFIWNNTFYLKPKCQ
jgi:hypothetical protein